MHMRPDLEKTKKRVIYLRRLHIVKYSQNTEKSVSLSSIPTYYYCWLYYKTKGQYILFYFYLVIITFTVSFLMKYFQCY